MCSCRGSVPGVGLYGTRLLGSLYISPMSRISPIRSQSPVHVIKPFTLAPWRALLAPGFLAPNSF